MNVHPTALISPRSIIADNVSIGPFAVVEDDVTIGEDCEISSHAVIRRYTSMGRGNRIGEHAVIGGEPQDVKFKNETSRLIIGDDNLIREFVTIHRASGEGEATRVGSRNFLMIGVH